MYVYIYIFMVILLAYKFNHKYDTCVCLNMGNTSVCAVLLASMMINEFWGTPYFFRKARISLPISTYHILVSSYKSNLCVCVPLMWFLFYWLRGNEPLTWLSPWYIPVQNWQHSRMSTSPPCWTLSKNYSQWMREHNQDLEQTPLWLPCSTSSLADKTHVSICCFWCK